MLPGVDRGMRENHDSPKNDQDFENPCLKLLRT